MRHNCLLLAAWLAIQGAVLAGPNDQDPAAALSARPTEDAVAWVAGAVEAARQLNEQLIALADRKLAVADAPSLSQAYATAMQLQRFGKRLSDLREPAGVDFDLRAERAIERIRAWVQEVRKLPDFPRAQNELARQFLAECRKRQKGLPNVRRLAQLGKLAEADLACNTLADELQAGQLWFDTSFWSPLLKPFAETRVIFAEQLRQEWKTRDAAWLAKMLEDARPQPEPSALLSEFRHAVDGLASSATISFRGKLLAGPQWVSAAFEEVERVQAAVVAYDACHWYAKGTRDRRMAQSFLALRDELPSLVAGAVVNEARRAGREEIPALYRDYVLAMAPLAARAFDEPLADSLQRALQPLLETSEELAEQVAGYRQATAGILAWRARTAEAYARARRKGVRPLEEVYLESVRAQPPLRGLMGASQKPMSLLDPADDLARAASLASVGRAVLLHKSDGSRGGAQPAASRFAGGCFALVNLARPSQAVIEALKADLFAAQSRKPLSLEAAAAIWGLENGCVEELGGQISSLQFDPLATACLAVTPADVQFIHTGPLITDQFIEPERQLCARLEVQPAWQRHKYQWVGR
jgi:hypothetical protein